MAMKAIEDESTLTDEIVGAIDLFSDEWDDPTLVEPRDEMDMWERSSRGGLANTMEMPVFEVSRLRQACQG